MNNPMGMGQPAPATAPAPDDSVENSALLPRSLFSDDVKPGDTITLTVSAIYGDEIEASVVSQTGETEEEIPMTADEEIDSMGAEV